MSEIDEFLEPDKAPEAAAPDAAPTEPEAGADIPDELKAQTPETEDGEAPPTIERVPPPEPPPGNATPLHVINEAQRKIGAKLREDAGEVAKLVDEALDGVEAAVKREAMRLLAKKWR